MITHLSKLERYWINSGVPSISETTIASIGSGLISCVSTAALISSFAQSDLPLPALPVHNTDALPFGEANTFQTYLTLSTRSP